MKLRKIMVFLVLLLLCGCMQAFASSVYEGSGTAEDPYLIEDAGDFITFTNALNNGEVYTEKYFMQTANIDLAGNNNYTGVKKSGNFYGTYNGNGKTINVNLSTTDERNIFPYVYGTIINLGTTGTINSSASGSYIVGIARSIRSGAVLANCYSTISINTTATAAGLCASCYGTLANCYFAGTLAGKSNFGLAASATADSSYINCYYTTGVLGGNVSGTSITEEIAKTTLASTLNDGRDSAASAAGVSKKDICQWTNQNGFAKHYISNYEYVSVSIQNPEIEAGKQTKAVLSVSADYVGSWEIDLGDTDATYVVAGDKKSVTITPGEKAGKVIARLYAVDESPISDDYTVTIHSSKVSIPGINMINGEACAVDFEDGYSYGLVDINGKALSVGSIPVVDYASAKDVNGNPATPLQNQSSKALLAYSDSANKGDGWYYVFGTAISELDVGRNYSAYAQIYTDNPVAHNSEGWLNNFETTNEQANITITYNSITNTWKEYEYSGVYENNSNLSVAFNTKQEALNDNENSKITVVAFDNAYIIPHYNITYHMPDGTIKTESINPVKNAYPLEFALDFAPSYSYEMNSYEDASGNNVFYTGLWTTSENGKGVERIPLVNKDIDLYPEIFEGDYILCNIDSYSEKTIIFNENVYVTDKYFAADVTGNGTKTITIKGKGYNGTLTIKNEDDKTLAVINLTGNHKWRPGLNVFTGTTEPYDIESKSAFDNNGSNTIVANPYNNSGNSSSMVWKTSSEKNANFGTTITFETPMDIDRPVRLDFKYTGNIPGSSWVAFNSAESSDVITSFGAPVAGTWSSFSCSLNYNRNRSILTKYTELSKIVLGSSGMNGTDYSLYYDDILLVPAYKIEFFDGKGKKIDETFYQPGNSETLNEFFSKTFRLEFNPNTRYIVNGEFYETNSVYRLKYEDLKITVLPNINAVMFSGDNATTVVPKAGKYVIPYPHELPGFLAEDFITWKTADGKELKPGTIVNTAEVTGRTLYAHCDASAFTRKPANGAIVNFASEQYNNWRANYQFKNVIPRSNADYDKEKGIVFSWQAEQGAVSYEVIYSRNKDMSNAVTLTTNTTTVTEHYLYAVTDYYWQIKTIFGDGTSKLSDVWKFTTADTPRIINEIGNFRDAGGKLTEDGKYRMKQGYIFRSQAVYSYERAVIDKFGIIADLDLRGSETGWITSSPLGEDIIFTIIEGTHYYGDATSTKHYANPTGQARFADEIRFFTDPSHYPMVFHCAGGRDRTGMLSYIIGAICGVPEEELFRDFELTWLSNNSGGRANAEQMIDWMRGFTNYINKYFEGNTFKERMEDYVRLCGVTDEEMDTIRSILLEEVPQKKPKTQTTLTKYSSYLQCEVNMTDIPLLSIICMAGYRDDRLVYCEIKTVTNYNETFEISENIDEIKVFVFENESSISPLTECETLSVG